MKDLTHIIEQVLAQEKNYQRKFYERYFSFAMKCAFRYFTGLDEAKDVVHDSFVKIFKGLPAFFADKDISSTPEFRLMAWIKRIVINTSIDHFRRIKKIPPLVEITENIWDDNADGISSDTNLLYKELLLELNRLSPAYRAIFNLHAIDGYSFKEIGEMLGITTGGAKAAYFKAKLALQRKLSGKLNITQAYVKP